MPQSITFVDVGNIIERTERQTDGQLAPGVVRRYVVIAFKLEHSHNGNRIGNCC